jgi:hypothetical protein
MLLLMIAIAAVAQTTNVAKRLLDSLTASQRRRISQDFDGSDRKDWHYVPRSRRGVPLADMTPQQKSSLDALLKSALSPQGFTKAKGVLELEPILGSIERSSFRDPGQYTVTMFGDPTNPQYGWRFEGHHLSLNFTVTPAATSATPAFFGANPATVPSGPRKGWRLLHDEEDLGRQLVRSLDAAQRVKAVISTRAPADIITGADREVHLRAFEGLPAVEMNADQRALLMRLVHVYVGNAAQATASRELAKIESAGVHRVYFAWAGEMEPRRPHYYRIHGPTILIEYDNTQNGANHVHSVWRSPRADFGEDLLRKHYA